MDFIKHTITWVKGEIFEATIYGSFGLLTIICSFLLWKYGETANSKAVIIPFAVVGVFFLATAISVIAENNRRLPDYIDTFEKNRAEFVKLERKRVEDFQYLYNITTIIATVSFTIATCFFLFTDNHVLRAIGIALLMFGLTGLIIDYFSKERADAYYKVITTEIKSQYN